ncbi:MAG: GNAT family N-acetyltransferase [Bacteroidota bacterium]
MSIRIAQPEDAKSLSQLAQVTFTATYGGLIKKEYLTAYVEKHLSENTIKGQIEQKSVVYLSAYNDRKIVGYAKLKWDTLPEALKGEKAIEVEKLYVDHSQQGKGLGDQLLKQSAIIGIEMGFKWLWLAVWENNSKAIQWYLKRGFEQRGTIGFQMADEVHTDYVMVKVL